ncbi:MAG: B3/B4 domain-containing protein [bacterium JZ-2024 1]
MADFLLDPALRAKGLQIGALVLEPIGTLENPGLLDAYIEKVVQEIRSAYAGRRPTDSLLVQRVRRLFSRVGADPTRYRPAPEALLRRVLRGESFPRILPVVDLANAVMLKYYAPLGIYDWLRVEPPVRIRTGRSGEELETFSGRRLNAEGKIVAEDPRGLFGSPIADGVRAMITENTQAALVLFYLPDESDAEGPMNEMSQRISEDFGGEVVREVILQ